MCGTASPSSGTVKTLNVLYVLFTLSCQSAFIALGPLSATQRSMVIYATLLYLGSMSMMMGHKYRVPLAIINVLCLVNIIVLVGVLTRSVDDNGRFLLLNALVQVQLVPSLLSLRYSCLRAGENNPSLASQLVR